jgi:hypothetical protein
MGIRPDKKADRAGGVGRDGGEGISDSAEESANKLHSVGFRVQCLGFRV